MITILVSSLDSETAQESPDAFAMKITIGTKNKILC